MAKSFTSLECIWPCSNRFPNQGERQAWLETSWSLGASGRVAIAFQVKESAKHGQELHGR